MSECRNCAGCEWVCEEHRDHPWAGLADVEECCGGAGAPCPVCSPIMACSPYTYPLLKVLESCPLPSTMGTAEEHYRRFYDWHTNAVCPAIDKARGE